LVKRMGHVSEPSISFRRPIRLRYVCYGYLIREHHILIRDVRDGRGFIDRWPAPAVARR
jgi:hypothetical protein